MMLSHNLATLTALNDSQAARRKEQNMGATVGPRWRTLKGKAAKAARLGTRPSFWPAARHGVAASVEHLSVPFDPGTRTVLDVGASRGQFAVLAAGLFPQARIVCFEPLPGPRAAIEKVLGDRVEIVGAAVGSRSGPASLNISARDDSSSLLPIGERQQAEFPGTGASGTAEVEVITLDEWLSTPLERPCLLKMDVQGFELAALRGATRTLASVDEALIECSFVELYEGQPLAGEVIAHMSDAGFRLSGVHGMVYSGDGSSVQADFFFRRQE
jgi:FkbM family methyltransferase